MQQSIRTRMLVLRTAAQTNARTRRSLAWLGGALVAGGIGVGLLRQPWAQDRFWTWLLLGFGMFAAAYSLRRLELWLPGEPVFPRLAPYPAQARRQLGAVLIATAVVITVYLVLRLAPDVSRWQSVIGYWFVALGMIAVGAWLVGAVGRAAPRAATELGFWADTRRNRWFERAAFLLILALALFLRTYRLDSIPPGIYVDETNGALDALYILEGRPASPFGLGWYQTPNGYLFYMAAIFQWFGANWTSLKLVSLLPAILTIPAVYLLARLLFGSFTGLAAMFFMAVARWHLSMSRWGWNETAPPLFQVLAFYFLIRGLRERRALDYALSGLLSGFVVYTYLSSRLVVATLALYILYWFWSDPEGWRASLRRSGQGILITAAAFFVAVAPIGVTYATDPFLFQNRVSEISVLNDIRTQGDVTPLVQNIGDILKFFHQTGDPQGKHNLPNEPMADPITGLLFALGVAYAILGWRDQRRVLLLLWLVIGLAGSYLSSHHESPQSYRALTALPAIVIMAADVLDRLVRALYRTLREQTFAAHYTLLPTLAAGGVTLLALGGAGGWESQVYFGPQAESIGVIRGFNATENGVARETIAALQEGKTVYLTPRLSQYSPLRFLLYGVVKAQTGKNTLDERPYHEFLPEVNFPIADDGKDALLLFESDYWNLRSYITSFYPDANIELVKLKDDSPIYMRVELTQAQIAALEGLTERVTYTDGRMEERAVGQVEFASDATGVKQVTWDGALRIDENDEYEPRVPDGVKVYLDGAPWTGRQYLGKGLYGLRIEWNGAGEPRFEWRIAGGRPLALPAGSLFRASAPQQGVRASFFKNDSWEGEPLYRLVAPFLMYAWADDPPIVPAGPFSARFRGTLRVPETGTYRFLVVVDDGARVSLDGTVMGEVMEPGAEHNLEMSVQLSQGEHPLEIDYFQQTSGGSLRVYWQRGDEPMMPLPPHVLAPAE